MTSDSPLSVPEITVSVVSHGHDDWLPLLLQDLAATAAGRVQRVVLTHNLVAVPLPSEGLPFELVQVQNKMQTALPLLPQAVQQQGVTVAKSAMNFLMVVGFVSADGRLTLDARFTCRRRLQ